MDGIELTVITFLLVALTGLIAGVLGGMLGVGGSVVMIPGLDIVLGPNQQLYQAAAMIANVAVALPATLHHRKADAIVGRVVQWMMPAALVFILIGVAASNEFRGGEGEKWLRRTFAAMLVYVIFANVRRLIKPRQKPNLPPGVKLDLTYVTPSRCIGVGAAMGLVAGLLGVGGGAIAVPLQHLFLRIPLRCCIANSAAVMCLSAGIGAIYKNATLAQHGYDWRTSLLLALLLSPTGWLGGRLGATLTHVLPIRWVRLAFILMMAAAAWRMVA